MARLMSTEYPVPRSTNVSFDFDLSCLLPCDAVAAAAAGRVSFLWHPFLVSLFFIYIELAN